MAFRRWRPHNVVMVEVIHLKSGEQPPTDAKFLLIQWKPGEGSHTEAHSLGVTQRVPEHLWDFMVGDAVGAAERMGFSKVYIQGKPDA